MMSGVEQRRVDDDEAGLRLDRWFKAHYPGLGFGQLQKLLRTGQIRVDGARAKPALRLAAGQTVRVPPLGETAVRPTPAKPGIASDAEALRQMVLYEDDWLYVLNKPFGLASQGGPGLKTHIDGMLEAWRDRKGQKPRLVHRLDRDTSGCLIVAKTRRAASELARTFRSRSARKIYWAVVFGQPRPHQGRISTWLKKEPGPEGEKMVVARHGDEGADHAVTHYSVIDHSAGKLSWVSLKPVTGRTHQLRVHMQSIGHPIIGDPKYFDIQNWDLPGGLQNRLHLLARRIALPHPAGGRLDVSAPLPPHMAQTFAVLGFDAERYDPSDDEENAA